MGYSWAAFGDFEIPAKGLAKLKKNEPPYVTSAESVREDGFYSDWVYEGNAFRYTSLFEKSMYGDKREVLDELLENVIAAGGTGSLVVVGFDDGGPDAGDELRIDGGEVVHRELSAADAEKARSHEAYRAIAAKVFGP